MCAQNTSWIEVPLPAATIHLSRKHCMCLQSTRRDKRDGFCYEPDDHSRKVCQDNLWCSENGSSRQWLPAHLWEVESAVALSVDVSGLLTFVVHLLLLPWEVHLQLHHNRAQLLGRWRKTQLLWGNSFHSKEQDVDCFFFLINFSVETNKQKKNSKSFSGLEGSVRQRNYGCSFSSLGPQTDLHVMCCWSTACVW